MDPTPDPDDIHALAAELALGLLEGDDLLAAAAREVGDPTFAREVEAWRSRFAAMADEIAPRKPPADAWPRLVASLDGRDSVVDLQLRRRMRTWRALAIGAVAATVALAALLVWPRPSKAPTPMFMASLTGAEGAPAFLALYDPVRGRYFVAPATVEAKPGRLPELWLIPAGGRPIAVGLAEFGRIATMPGPAPSGAGATLAVSLEPPGGSPTGQPTGPVIAKGALRSL